MVDDTDMVVIVVVIAAVLFAGLLVGGAVNNSTESIAATKLAVVTGRSYGNVLSVVTPVPGYPRIVTFTNRPGELLIVNGKVYEYVGVTKRRKIDEN